MPIQMRDSLDHLPGRKQRDLGLIKDILFEEFDKARAESDDPRLQRARILRIILFGSHARGTWVEDYRRMDGPYISDYDIMVVVDETAALLPHAHFWDFAEDRFLNDPRLRKTPITLITETWETLNHRLEQGQFFYTDVVAEGILLFSGDGRPLADKKDPTPEEARAIAQEHFEQWMPRAKEFLMGSDLMAEKGSLNLAAFMLHQATECAYACFLTTIGGYMPHTHNIKRLRGLAETLDHKALVPVWPRQKKKERALYELLKDAYIKGRYSKHYKIDPNQLTWLREKVVRLHEVVEGRCGSMSGEDEKSAVSP